SASCRWLPTLTNVPTFMESGIDTVSAPGSTSSLSSETKVASCCLRGADHRSASGHDDVDFCPQEIADQRRYRSDVVTIVAKLKGDVAPFGVAEVVHPALECLLVWIVVRGSASDVPDARGLVLRARRERPRGRCAAQQRDEVAPLQP